MNRYSARTTFGSVLDSSTRGSADHRSIIRGHCRFPQQSNYNCRTNCSGRPHNIQLRYCSLNWRSDAAVGVQAEATGGSLHKPPDNNEVIHEPNKVQLRSNRRWEQKNKTCDSWSGRIGQLLCGADGRPSPWRGLPRCGAEGRG